MVHPPFLRSSSFRSFKALQSDEFEDTNLGESKTGLNYFNLFSFAIVNAAVAVPCLFGYASIIFNSPIYKNSMGDLTKLVIFSSAVHQMMFSLLSTLWFSIGQVQDAGLIFLSYMAFLIAASSPSEEAAVSTAVVLLGVATSALGVVMVLVGKLKLAKWVYLIPTPVIAGYLGFIGFFCFAAGLGLACDEDISTWQHVKNLILDSDFHDWQLIAPAVISGLILSHVSGRKNAPWFVLPLTIFLIPTSFYVVLFFSGTSLEESRDLQWMNPVKAEDSQPFWYLVNKVHFDLVDWSLLPMLFPTWLSMCFVVCFASALDIVALEMDTQSDDPPIDLNRELVTVGWSNFVSGLLGGYTGSYIFSVTLFTKRSKLNSRLVGLSLVGFELALFVAPLSLLSFVPKFFFASTLIFIAVDLTVEWLYEVYFRMSAREYFTVWLTFFAIAFTENNLVLGIALGCLFSFVCDQFASSRFAKNAETTTTDCVAEKEEAQNIMKLDHFLFGTNLETLFFQVSEVFRPHSSQTNTVTPPGENTGLLPPRKLQEDSTLILDFSSVKDMDSAQTAWGLNRLRKLAHAHRAQVIFSGMNADIQSRLRANGVVNKSDVLVCTDLNHAKQMAKEKRAMKAVYALARLRSLVNKKKDATDAV